MKNDGKVKIYTKNELIEKLNYYLDLQIGIATDKEKQYREYEKEKKSSYNPHLKELNNQIVAITKTSQMIIRINDSDLDNEDDSTEEVKSNELVD